LILEQLRLYARKNNELLKSVTRYIPDDFDFCGYLRVWTYHSSPEYGKTFSVDIFARSLHPGDYSIIGEVMEFENKFLEVKKLENVERAVGFIFSRCGFTKKAENYCREKGIACSEDERWLSADNYKI
jgi:hypothetical protein